MLTIPGAAVGVESVRWIDIPFNAGNFTGNGSMTWTVAEADVKYLKSVTLGKLCVVAFDIVTTTVGGTPSNILRMDIPLTAAGDSSLAFINPLWRIDDGTSGLGVMSLTGGTSRINFFVDGTTATAWSTATDTTRVSGQIIFEIA